MSYKVFTYYPRAQSVVDRIIESGVKIEFVMPEEISLAAACQAIVDCNAMIEDKTTHIGVCKELIDSVQNMEVIISPSIGYDTIDVKYAESKGVYVVNSSGASTTAVAEATILLMLACNRNFSFIDEKFRRLRKDYPFYVFDDPSVHGIELRGKTLGLIGCGAIGRAVATIAFYGFGMRVIGCDPFLKQFPEYIERRECQEDVFMQSDFVSLHLPSTTSTIHSIGKDLFKLMKPTAYFINVSRGNIVCQNDLIDVLETHQIAGAGLDVYDPEPLDESSYRLFDLPNVCITPHTAGFTKEASKRYSEYEAQNLLEAARGQVLTRSVNHPNNPRNRRL